MLSIKISEKRLERCEKYKYLGVIFDQNLSWQPHVEYIHGKISKACGALSKIRHCVDIELLRSVYYALVHSYLRYGIVAWGNASESVLRPLHSLLNRIVRIMTFAPFRIDTGPIFKYLEFLNISQIFLIETGKFVFKARKGILPISTIADHFVRATTTHQYNLRTSNQRLLVTPLVLLSSFKRKSLHIRGIDMWNKFPELLKLSESMNIFKRGLKLYLLEDQNDLDLLNYCSTFLL